LVIGKTGGDASSETAAGMGIFNLEPACFLMATDIGVAVLNVL
jgi:hypothetical protein